MDEELKKLREEIDRIDAEMLSLIEERVGIARKIGTAKKKKGLSISDPQREKEIIDNVTKAAKIDKEFAKKLFASIIEYCKNEEKKQGGDPRP